MVTDQNNSSQIVLRLNHLYAGFIRTATKTSGSENLKIKRMDTDTQEKKTRMTTLMPDKFDLNTKSIE
jgi:hypothetical protein